MLSKVHSFTRTEHLLFSLPLLFAGAWLGAGGCFPSWRIIGFITLVGLGARTFGMALNRILDRDLDAKNPRTKNREIPAGRLSLFQGYVVAAVGLFLYFVGCAGLGSLVLALSFFPLVPLSLYSLLKRFTPLCHYGIGFVLATAPVGAFVAASNSLDFTSEILWFALFTFCWMSGFDIIYALLDVDFDRAHHVYSLPALLGPTRALWVAALTHVVAIGALMMLVKGWVSALFFGVALFGFLISYSPKIPVAVRFFPISIVVGVAGALVVFFIGT
jgi:4-hydroxybenzoate polyprenyltransferase